MNVRALVQAGGRGERMGGATPKPLVPVLGLPLLERNLALLFAAGLRDVTVVTPAARPEIREFVERSVIARAFGGAVAVYEEPAPRGTIGAAAELRDGGDVLVVNADNLTALDLAALVAHHDGATMTVATHVEPFRVPFGAVDVEGGRLTAYREKPALPVRVCSGTYVLGRAALARLPASGRVDAPDLVRALLESGEEVRAFGHAAPWIDVNDASAVARAAALVRDHAAVFERWFAPEVEVVGALLTGPRGALLEARPAGARCYAGLWDTPGGKIEPGETAGDAIRRELDEELGLGDAELRPLAVFDDVDPTSGRRFRHHVFTAALGELAVVPRLGQRLAWSGDAPGPLAVPAARALAYGAP